MFADNNLFNPAWTTGSLSAIAPIVQVVGFCAMCLISVGGFFMVILPIMRNVVNGIVAVAPNMCDKIDEAHRNKLGLQHSEGGNQIQMVIGSISMIVLSFLPNFKAMSDFDEGIRDPKSYMLKALPMMCIYVFIGVFIFYGYPAKFAEKFSTAATGVIDMALNNVDPTAWIEKIPTNLARPDLSTNNATDVKGKNINKVSKSLYSAFTSKYGQMSKDNRIALSHEIEEEVSRRLNEITTHSESSKFKMSVETRVSTFDPQLNSDAVWPAPAHDTKENIFIYQFKGVVSEAFNIGIPGGVEGHHYMVTLKFFELSEENASADNVSNIATLNKGDVVPKGTGDECIWNVPTNHFWLGGTSVTLNGQTGTVESVSDKDGPKYKVTFKVSKDTLTAATSGNTSGIAAFDKATKKQHTVAQVIWGTSYKCTPKDSAKWNEWVPSAGPTPKKASDGTSSTEDTGRKNDGNTGE